MANLSSSSKPSWLNAALRADSALLADRPVAIVDVGAAGAPPANQARLAAVSTYLGFDPDLRSPQTGNAFGFLKHSMLNRAITAHAQETVTFHLTRYPECSSVLRPDSDETNRYAIGRFFEVVGQASVPAMTLDAALAEAGLTQIDWLKLDTQGTDYDLLTSLHPACFNRLLAVDVEPGVTTFYHGENTVAQLHDHLLKNGFWLADLNQQKFPRLSVSTINALNLDDADIALLDRNPFALELRYLRTFEHLESHGFAPRDFFALWLIAMANGHTAYALEVAAACKHRGTMGEYWGSLVGITLEHARASKPRQPNAPSRMIELCVPPILPKVLRRLRRWFE